MKRNFTFLAMIIISVSFFSSCHKNNAIEPQNTTDATTNDRIGLYLDNGVFDACRTDMVSMLNQMNCNYTVINKDSILSGCLERYGLLLIPGGDMWTYRDYLGNNGMNIIKEYVNQGGGYIGICGGAYFSAYKVVWHGWAGEPRNNSIMYGLNLLSGTAEGPIDDFAPSYIVEQCKILLTNKSHPICKDLPDTIAPYYHHGPKFIIDSSQTISVLGKTVSGEKTSIIAFRYSSGRVFLINSHPEFDSEGSSWGILRNAINWCSLR